jgi:hypothetical protein
MVCISRNFAPDSFILNSKPVYPGALTDPGGDLTAINVRLRGLTRMALT